MKAYILTKIASSCDGALSIAILRRSESLVQSLLESKSIASYLAEKDCNGRTVFHLCSTWPTGLRLLLAQHEAHEVMDAMDMDGIPPVLYALSYSGSVCNANDKWAMCARCDCCASLNLLLEAGCSIALDLLYADALEICSLRARILLLEHLRDRRQRLEKVALSTLSSADLEVIGLPSRALLDVSALSLWEILHKRIPSISTALCPTGDPRNASGGLYHTVHCYRIAEIAYDIGFVDCDAEDEERTTPLMRAGFDYRPETCEEFLQYFYWLVNRGANLERSPNQLMFAAAHNVAAWFGHWVAAQYKDTGMFPELRNELGAFCSRVCNTNVHARFPCACSTESGFSPLNRFLVELLPEMGKEILFAKDYVPNLVLWLSDTIRGFDKSDTMRATLFRFVIMGALGVRHICPRDSTVLTMSRISQPWYYGTLGDLQERQQEWKEIQEEDTLLITEMAELLEEAEREYKRLDISLPCFLREHWAARIDELRRAYSGGFSKDQVQDLKEIGVVIRRGSLL
jgi:hypothetical protein